MLNSFNLLQSTQQSEIMGLRLFEEQMLDFTNKIKQALKLKQDHQLVLHYRKTIISWICEQTLHLKELKDKNKNDGLLQGALNLIGLGYDKKIDFYENTMQMIKEAMRTEKLNVDIQSIGKAEIPSNVKYGLNYLYKRQIPINYGSVSGPFLQNFYISKKDDYDSCVTKVIYNGLKFTSIGTEANFVHKYQRKLVQELFGRIFKGEGTLSLVIKIEVENKNLEKIQQIYCYIEDFSQRDQFIFKDMNDIRVVGDQYDLQIDLDAKPIRIDSNSFLLSFLADMIVLPVQTFVADYSVAIHAGNAFIVKLYERNRSESVTDISKYIKEHPAIRNPIFYYYPFIKMHPFKVDEIKLIETKLIYANFYESLNILVQFMLTDFHFRIGSNHYNSLAFDDRTLTCLWNVFHQLVLLPDWIEQMISPIKKEVTISQIAHKFCPIFNDMINIQKQSYNEFKQYLLNIPIQSYLAQSVCRVHIERYKDMFLGLNGYNDPNIYQNKKIIYLKVFSNLFNQFDISNCSIYEALYFLNFISKNNQQMYSKQQNFIHQSWKDRKIWKKIYKLKEAQNLCFISMTLDILGFALDIDTVQLSKEPFQNLKNQKETEQIIHRISFLIETLSQSKYEKKIQRYLSKLLQKSFRFKKYKISKYLIEQNIQINCFEEIFLPLEEVLSNSNQKLRQEEKDLIELIRNKQPEMHRRYKWEELVNVILKQKSNQKDVVQLKTFNKGIFFVEKAVYAHLTSRQTMNNTISRQDYMHSDKRKIAKVTLIEDAAYIEITEFPLLRYFYSIFLEKIGKKSLMINFCGFFGQSGTLIHLLQCIPKCLNFEKGLHHSSQSQLKNFTNFDDISEAIIISIILMSTNIQLKNIIVSPTKIHNKSLFIIDFHDFYQKNAFELLCGNVSLKVKNSLFMFDEMHNIISDNIMKKYSNLDILEIIKETYQEAAQMVIHANKVKPKQTNQSDSQLYGIIFQNGFLQTLTERMFKISETFDRCLTNKKNISHMEMLEIISPPLSYYYQQLIQSSPSLLERQKHLVDDSWKKPFVNSQALISFFARSYPIEQTHDKFPNHYKKFNFEGPTESLNNFYHNILKFTIYTDKITDIRNYSHSVIQYFIKNIDLSKYSKEEKEDLIVRIQEYSKEYLNRQNNRLPLSIIRLNSIDLLKEKHLKFSHERLKELIFEDLKFSESQLTNLLKKFQCMSHIRLFKVKGVEKIGQLYLYMSSTLQIKNLKYLQIINCPEIETIDIKCDQLENLVIRNNKVLSNIYINSKRLRIIDCSLSPKLKLQNIGIYIFKMINVLLCNNSCNGDLKKLQHKNYSTFLFRILRYLLNKYDSNQDTLDIIITLMKVGVIDEKLFNFGSSTKLSSNLISFIAKAGWEMMNVLQQQILELFLSNKYVQNIDLDQLMKVSLTTQKIISNYFLNGRVKKHFRQLSFNDYVKRSIQAAEQLSYLSIIFEHVQLEKSAKLNLALSKDIEEKYYLEILNLILSKVNLQRLELCLINSLITHNYFQAFARSSKGYKLQFNNCQISTILKTQFSDTVLKQLTINNSKLANADWITSVSNLTSIEIGDCKFEFGLEQLFQQIGKMSKITNLKLNKIRQEQKQFNILYFFKCLSSIDSLKILDFSGNHMNKEELQIFNREVSKLTLQELTLLDFYNKDAIQNISSFVINPYIKALNIELYDKNIEILYLFIQNLSENKRIIRLYLKTNKQIESIYFEPLKNNKKLEKIHSNHYIPNWLKNHVDSNSADKSMILDYLPFEPQINSGGKTYDYYRIGLSLDGGGLRGLLLATQLDYLVKEVGQPIHKIFDCVGGTSIGGILSLASTGSTDGYHPVCGTQDLIDIFQKYGNKIFKKSSVMQLASLFDAKYDVKSFEDLLYSYFKDCRLSDVLADTNVIVTAVNRLNNFDFTFKSNDSMLDREKDFYMRDVARATSAAPTYFPAAEIKNINASEKFSLIDGGMGLNNPSKLVIDEIIKLSQNQSSKKNFFLLSLGTGRLKNDAIPKNAGIKDLAPIIDSFSEAANNFQQRDMEKNYEGYFLRVSPEINLSKRQGELDNSAPEILKVYTETALQTAEQNFSNKIAYGKYKNLSLVEWLKENTARKYDI